MIPPLYATFTHQSRESNAVTAAGVTLLALSLLAITVSAISLRLPGITMNRMRFLWMPAVFILLPSFSLLALAFRINQARDRAFTPYYTALKVSLTDYDFPTKSMPEELSKKGAELSKEDRERKKELKKEIDQEKEDFRDWILDQLPKPAPLDFLAFMIAKLKKEVPKNSPKYKALEAALEKAVK